MPLQELKQLKVKQADENNSDKDIYNIDSESDNPDKNKDFFEQMTCWQLDHRGHEDMKRHKAALEKKEMRKQMIGANHQMNSYHLQKQLKKPANLSKLKPILGGKYPQSFMQGLSLFK